MSSFINRDKDRYVFVVKKIRDTIFVDFVRIFQDGPLFQKGYLVSIFAHLVTIQSIHVLIRFDSIQLDIGEFYRRMKEFKKDVQGELERLLCV